MSMGRNGGSISFCCHTHILQNKTRFNYSSSDSWFLPKLINYCCTYNHIFCFISYKCYLFTYDPTRPFSNKFKYCFALCPTTAQQALGSSVLIKAYVFNSAIILNTININLLRPMLETCTKMIHIIIHIYIYKYVIQYLIY